MHDAGVVGHGERPRHLRRPLNHVAVGRRLPAERPQRLADDELHRDVLAGVCLADVVDGYDVRVVEGRGDPGFVLEAPGPLRVARQVSGQELHRGTAPETRILDEVDHAHPTGAQRIDHAVVSDPLAGPSAAESSARTALTVPGRIIATTDRRSAGRGGGVSLRDEINGQHA